MMGGAACVFECLWVLFLIRLFSLYKLKGVCHQHMFVLGVWWCVIRYMMFCHCDGCALFFLLLRLCYLVLPYFGWLNILFSFGDCLK